MTNFEKLVRWNADWYKSLGDSDCIVCLTEKQIYLVLMAIDPLTWVRTRWAGNTDGLDFEAIKGELVYQLSENMTCDKLSEILNRLTEIETKLDYVFENVKEGDTFIDGDTTTIFDILEMEDGSEQIGGDISGCDYDAIWGMVVQLVNYINQQNVDFLENASQFGNIGQMAEFIQEVIPGFDIVSPTDEFTGYAGFILEEMIDEYQATVDDELLQEVACDLFCYATAGGVCSLTFDDVLGYFRSKVSPSIAQLGNVFNDIIRYATTGTFSGDEYFYYMCYSQLMIVYAGMPFFEVTERKSYEMQANAGRNSPDADWSIFCDPCDAVYWHHQNNFLTDGIGKWEILTGNLVGGRVEGVNVGGGSVQATIKLTTSKPFKLNKSTVIMDRVGIESGSDFTRIRLYEDYDGDPGTFVTWQNHTFENDGEIIRCLYSGTGSTPTITTIIITCAAQGGGGQEVAIKFVELDGENRMDFGIYAEGIDPC